MHDQLVVPVDKLVGTVGRERKFQGERSVSLRLGEVIVDGPMNVSGVLVGTTEGVDSSFRAVALANLVCTRCLLEWSEEVEATGSQYFRTEPDEDGYGIVDNAVDVGAPAQDELALSLPAVPICRPGCAGLCPTCGTDLNRDPCDGHGDDSDSPFAVLKDLFDS
ncbi:MAG TPA: DUF177 domain-containing protein [Acidimicrobiia bacterium]